MSTRFSETIVLWWCGHDVPDCSIITAVLSQRKFQQLKLSGSLWKTGIRLPRENESNGRRLQLYIKVGEIKSAAEYSIAAWNHSLQVTQI